MGRPKSKGAYVPLAALYFMDDAILGVSPMAELLFVRTLSFLASVPTDGFVTDKQLRSVVAIGLRNVPNLITELTQADVITAQDGGFVARSWQKWNRSVEEVGRLLAKDRERKARDSAERGTDSVRIPDGIQPDSTLQSRAVQSSTEQSSTEEIPTESLSSEVADATPRPEIGYLLDLLDNEILSNGGKPPTRTKKNRDAVRLMLDRDGLTVDQIERAIRWCQADEFWRANILSAAKLREKYESLRLAATRTRQTTTPSSKAARNAAEYQRIFGGDRGHAGSIQALDSGIGS